MPSRKTVTCLAAAACWAVWLAPAPLHASMISGPYNVTVGSSTDTYYVLVGDSGTVYDILQQDTWTDDQAEAQALGTNLITIDSADQNSMVVSDVAQDFTSQNGPDLSDVPLWIGYNDMVNDPNFGGTDDGPGGTNSQHAADFTWVDGSTSTYTNWNVATNEPNDDGGEYYAALNWHYADGDPTALGTWNDAPNTGTAGYGGNTGNDTGYFGIAYVPEPTSFLAGLGLCGFLLKRPAPRRKSPG
jgi:hypothetical protein